MKCSDVDSSWSLDISFHCVLRWERLPQWMHVSQVWLGSFFQDLPFFLWDHFISLLHRLSCQCDVLSLASEVPKLDSPVQDHMLGCSPVGLEERILADITSVHESLEERAAGMAGYHMPIDLRSVVPIVPTGLPDNRSHHNVSRLNLCGCCRECKCTQVKSGARYCKVKRQECSCHHCAKTI